MNSKKKCFKREKEKKRFHEIQRTIKTTICESLLRQTWETHVHYQKGQRLQASIQEAHAKE
jgi:hypothetical protein